jgi:truncated hemoglobin YjbI
MTMTGISLYDRLGGAPALEAGVDRFYERLTADPDVGRFFPFGVRDHHRARFTALFGQALGGPERYDGPDLRSAHARLRITGHQFDVTAGHLVATLDELGIDPAVAAEVVAVVASLRDQVVAGDA